MSARAFYPPALMSREAAAEYIGISPRLLDQLQSQGHLIPKKQRSKRLFLREDLDAYASSLPDWERAS